MYGAFWVVPGTTHSIMDHVFRPGLEGLVQQRVDPASTFEASCPLICRLQPGARQNLARLLGEYCSDRHGIPGQKYKRLR